MKREGVEWDAAQQHTYVVLDGARRLDEDEHVHDANNPLAPERGASRLQPLAGSDDVDAAMLGSDRPERRTVVPFRGRGRDEQESRVRRPRQAKAREDGGHSRGGLLVSERARTAAAVA